MTRIIALTQFIIVSIGTFALHLLVKVGGQEKNPRHIDDVAQFIARYALWFFAVPILYAVCTNSFRGGSESQTFKMAGFFLCAVLLVLFGIPLHYYLN